MVQQHESGYNFEYEGQAYLSYHDLDEEGNKGDRVVLVYGIAQGNIILIGYS